ncbi:DUF4249 domain-containing protein [Hymenobacter properus]|uniref:DUF4249 domain-containing protein n=1 Tax=Hymenobacter properus TaxID=2791026 RepID=A0A931BFQ5_9BACT|nr:DUF4249 domain-containing protein [Hymenobacter properus]MBF9143064.1 DUF4249 domain-containing protein [Hymenobacter properus]MBR7721872.1 DUF4249 domain-containing protein [Microvirga sp. SRT04]
MNIFRNASPRPRASLGLLLALLAGCTDPYMPDVITAPSSYLVVDGSINTAGVTTIRLSRTQAVASKSAVPVETRAVVYIEDEGGTRYALTETSVKGTYASAALTLNPARKYRLHLNTTGGKEYASDYVPAKLTPPIDAVTWNTDSNGLNILVSTHDAANATQYYRWETDETWEIRPPYTPDIEYFGGAIRNITVRYPTLCWGNERATRVLLTKTTSLTQDVVSGFRVQQLLPTSERLYTRYSILVQQHALTQEEYSYWELLRKNTESIGTLFDPQPARLTGNVHSLSSPTEVVLGFVSAHSITEKRIFIRNADLPSTWPVVSGYEACMPADTVFVPPPGVFPPPKPEEVLLAAFGQNSILIPITRARNSAGDVVGYTAKVRDCVDCRTRGTTVRPSFW